MLVAFWAVLPVFLIIGMGVFLRARDLLPDSTGKVLGLYVLKLALPLLLLHVMSQADRNTLAHGGFWLGALGAPLGCYALGYWADRLFCRRGAGAAVISGQTARWAARYSSSRSGRTRARKQTRCIRWTSS